MNEQELITQIVSLKSKYDETYFNLQKEREKVKYLVSTNKKLVDRLKFAEDKNKVLEKEIKDNKNTEIALLKKENQILKANVQQLRKGIEQKLNTNKRQTQSCDENDTPKVKSQRKQSCENKNKRTNIQQTPNHNENKTTNTEESTENIYEVEKLLKYKWENKKRVFLVRWRNYDSSYDTWEPEKNLNCRRILKAFLKANN